ncbi:unnamed protein product [Fusarium equiseti]|uniref:Uncharacterized protein n=1 Tax=Fusarium equiseti TaxID=61235 RepID=A0A8J2IWA5_FUSEQ|nr:unnamed protein product [Fusarium equiseti]
MFSKGIAIAVIVTYMAAGSAASPCKVDLKTTTDLSAGLETSLAADSSIGSISTGLTQTELPTTTSGVTKTTILASTLIATVSSTDYETTGAPTTSTVQASISSEAFPAGNALTTTQLLANELSPTLKSVITVIESATTSATTGLTTTTDVVGEDATTTVPAIDTTATLELDATTTAEPVTPTSEENSTVFTTTSEDPITPTFIVNSGFDDSSSSYDPWTFSTSNRELGIDIKVNIDSATKHEGSNSARFEYIRSGVSYLRQPLTIIPKAGTMYPMSAWTRTTGQTISRCNSARIQYFELL